MGAYDVNFLGRYVEVGAQYENLGGSSSGVVWFRDPRFLGKRIRLGIDLWSVMRNRMLYANDRSLIGGYTLQRNMVNLFGDKEWTRYFKTGLSLARNWDKLSDEKLSDQEKQQNSANAFNVNSNEQTLIIKPYFEFGRLNYENYLVSGYLTELKVGMTSTRLLSDRSFTSVTLDNRAFWRLPSSSNLGLKLSFGHTNTDSLQHLFYLGGLENVRGYLDAQYRGKSFVQANAEFRIPSVERNWFVLQHVVFVDSGRVGQELGDLVSGRADSLSSLGAGVRLISPKIYRLNIRLDYAKSFGLGGGQGLSFGLQQFY